MPNGGGAGRNRQTLLQNGHHPGNRDPRARRVAPRPGHRRQHRVTQRYDPRPGAWARRWHRNARRGPAISVVTQTARPRLEDVASPRSGKPRRNHERD
eukprot:2723650-Lingulodinium_polyedra.AAC.1